MSLWQTYRRPRSVDEALRALTSAPGLALPIAGGTDLILDLRQGRHEPVHTLVDVTAIPEMTTLEIREGELYVGAAVPLSRVAVSPLVKEHARALSEACALIGGPQVRNVATLGGNVAHALPAADGTIALVALNARAEVASLDGCRRVPLLELFRGPGQSALRAGELILGFVLPLRASGQSSAFRRVMRPQGVALPILNMAVFVAREGDEVADIRIAVGPSGPTPRRAIAAEDALRGRPLSDENVEAALAALLTESRFRTSPLRASAAYRRHLVGVLLKDTLETAWERAGTG